MIKRQAPRLTSPNVRVPAAWRATTARSVPMSTPNTIASKSFPNITTVESMNCSGPSMEIVYSEQRTANREIHNILFTIHSFLFASSYSAQLPSFGQNLWNARGLHAKLVEHVWCRDVFAQDDLIVEKLMFFTIGKCCKTR